MAEIPGSVEQQIAELERALAEKRAVLEQKKIEGGIAEIPHEKEILREVVREKITNIPPSKVIPSIPLPPPPPLTATGAHPPSYYSDELRTKVEEFVKLALEKSLDEAVGLVKATGNAALIDAFHDIIVDELYSYLVETGKLPVIK